MKYQFDTKEFSKQVKMKRVIELNTGLREVAAKAKISISTLSRIENERIPDIQSLILISNWLQVSPSIFFKVQSKK